jgi:hypothetical protein
MYFGVVLIICCLFLQSCSHDTIAVSLCSIHDFAQADSEGFIEQLEQPIIVRNIKGRIANTTGGWPDKSKILIELRRIGDGAKTIQAHADCEGNFEIPLVAKGHYCFKVTVAGWRSVMGIIKVDRRADPAKTILIVMSLDV